MLEECVDSWVTQWKQQGMLEGKQQGIAEGMQKGIQKGMLEGKQQGIQQGEMLMLKRQLHKRFGALPSWVETRLQHAAPNELEQWADAILDAATLEAVFSR